jgi:hypothetical protein
MCQVPNHYLIFESKPGTMFLSSDSVTNSMTFHKKMEPILSQIPKEKIEHFKTVGSTIGSKVLFPGKKLMDFKLLIKHAVSQLQSRTDSISLLNA